MSEQGATLPPDILDEEQKKAERYELGHFVFQGAVLHVPHTPESESPRRCMMTYGDAQGWLCMCSVFHEYRVCSHLMALERLLPSFPVLELSGLVGKSCFAVNATYIIKPGFEGQALQIFSSLAALTRMELGNLSYTVHRSLVNPRRFFLYECYVNREAFETHCASGPFAQYVTRGLLPLAESHHSEEYETV
jgi:quinol monooxygenase YgiN